MTDPGAAWRGVPRREAILAAAAELFHQHGYHAVSVQEIGAAAGVSGPAVYRHFRSKQALLVTLFERAMERLVERAHDAIAAGGEPSATLEALVQVHVSWVIDDLGPVAVYDQEQFNLPDDARRRLRRAQRLYVEEWVHLLRELRPDLIDAQARSAVHAVMGLVHSTTKHDSGLPREQLRELLARMAMGALDAPRPQAGPGNPGKTEESASAESLQRKSTGRSR